MYYKNYKKAYLKNFRYAFLLCQKRSKTMKNFDEAVNNLINMFKNEDFPQKLALTIIKRVDEGIRNDNN